MVLKTEKNSENSLVKISSKIPELDNIRDGFSRVKRNKRNAALILM